MDADRYALRQSDPIEGGIDVRQQIAARRSLAILDARGDAFNMAFQMPAISHELHGGAIADVNVCELGFLEITVDMQRGGVGDAESRMARREIDARLKLDIRRDAIHLRQDGGPLQIQRGDIVRRGRLGERGPRLAYGGLRLGEGRLS